MSRKPFNPVCLISGIALASVVEVLPRSTTSPKWPGAATSSAFATVAVRKGLDGFRPATATPLPFEPLRPTIMNAQASEHGFQIDFSHKPSVDAADRKDLVLFVGALEKKMGWRKACSRETRIALSLDRSFRMKNLFILALTLVSICASAASNVDSDTILENAKLLAKSQQINKLISSLRSAGWDYHGFVRDNSECFGDCYKVELAFERWEYPEGKSSLHIDKVFTVSVDKASTDNPQVEIQEGKHPFGTFLGWLNR